MFIINHLGSFGRRTPIEQADVLSFDGVLQNHRETFHRNVFGGKRAFDSQS